MEVQKVLEQVEKDNIKFITLQFTDLLGVIKAEALDALKEDKVLQETLGKHLFERYIDVKTKEWDQFKQQVTNWEIETYLDIF